MGIKTKQYPHQAKEFKEHGLAHRRALLWQMRTGKTKMAIDTACALYQALEITGVIVIAPNGIHRQWAEQQIPLHGWGATHMSFPWRFADPKNEAKFHKFYMAWPHFEGLHWLMLNSESLIRDEIRDAIKLFIRYHKDFLLIVDESHQFAKPGSKRSRLARALAERAPYSRILTGTVMENRPLQIWSQFELLAPGILGYSTYGAFCADYAIYSTMRGGGRQWQEVVGYRNLEKLRNLMAKWSSVVLRSDCEGLPDVQYETVYIEMGPAQTKAWKSLKEDMVEEILDLGLGPEAMQGGVRLNKLQQIESGFLVTDTGLLRFEQPKMLALINELEQYNAIIWCRYTLEITDTFEYLIKQGFKVAMYHGKMSHQEREKSLGLMKKGELDALIAQPEAAGQGRDLSDFNAMIWISQSPDAMWRSQADERSTRVGGKSTLITDFIIKGGVNEYYRSLTKKKMTLANDISRIGLKAILEGLNAY